MKKETGSCNVCRYRDKKNAPGQKKRKRDKISKHAGDKENANGTKKTDIRDKIKNDKRDKKNKHAGQKKRHWDKLQNRTRDKKNEMCECVGVVCVCVLVWCVCVCVCWCGVCVCVLCVCCVCWSKICVLPRTPRPSAGPPLRRTAPPPDRPKFRSFFSFSHPRFHSFFSLWGSSRVFFPLSGGLLVEFWWCFWSVGTSNVLVFALRLSCERRPRRHPEREKKTREDPQREKKEKKARNFGPPTLRGPTLRAPTLRGPTLRGPTLRGPTLRGSTLRALTFSGFGPPPLGGTTLGGPHPAPNLLAPTLLAPTLRGPTFPRFAPLPPPLHPALSDPCFFCPVCHFLFCPKCLFLFCPKCFFFLSRLCFFCPECIFLFCPPRVCLFCPVSVFFVPVRFFCPGAATCVPSFPSPCVQRSIVFFHRQRCLPWQLGYPSACSLSRRWTLDPSRTTLGCWHCFISPKKSGKPMLAWR